MAAKQLAAVVLTKVAKPGSNPNRSLKRACNSGSWPGRTRRDRGPGVMLSAPRKQPGTAFHIKRQVLCGR